MLVGADGELGGPVAKNLSDAELAGLSGARGRRRPATRSSSPLASAAPSQELLGAARLEIGRRCDLIDESLWKFLWVVDAPMFEPTADGGWTAVHHPFTSPKPEFADTFHEAPGEALAYAYDIVVNGSEIGGGSIRIHRGEMQQRVFDVIGLTKDEAEVEVRLPARGVRVRSAAARRYRAGLGPRAHDADGHRVDPRGDRVPEDGFRRRPAHWRTDDHYRAAAQRGWH